MAYSPDLNAHMNYAGPPMAQQRYGQNMASSSGSSAGSTFNSTTPPPAHQNQSHPVHQRRIPHLPRGVLKPADGQAQDWLYEVQQVLSYEFRTPELLEEALESPGSGITSVGEGERYRHFLDGNEDLAGVGGAVIKMVLMDSCYLSQISKGEAKKQIESLTSVRSLGKIGKQTRIEAFVRPMMPLRKKNLWTVVKDDVKREDTSVTIARALVAIIGAVFYDGGLVAVRKVMVDLGLEVRAAGV
ncbi:RNase [Phlyctema vagabunda]|uniref:RNase n=1 Tax=Phlyctema vagabunda TaxID=108571 RepID=A0ABR4PFY4_9HELO